MNDVELEKALATLTTPAPEEETRDRVLHHATLALVQTRTLTTSASVQAMASRRSTPWLAWRGEYVFAAVAALAVLLVGVRLLFLAPRAFGPAAAIQADRAMLAQVEQLFPGQLNAVIEQDGTVRLDLTARPASAGRESQPLLVQLERPGRSLRVLSYSGHTICIDLNGAKVCVEALLTGDGDVVLTGPDFLWTRGQTVRLAGYRITARSLAASSL